MFRGTRSENMRERASGLFDDVTDERSADAFAHEGGTHEQVLELQPVGGVYERGEADDLAH